MVVELLIFGILTLVIPVFVGGIFAYVDKGRANILFRWISGQFLLWAGFQLLCVPMILKEDSFDKVVAIYWWYMGALVLMALGSEVRRCACSENRLKGTRIQDRKKISDQVLLVILLGLLVLQLVQAVRLAYADGDDAYYVAITSITQDADTMYLKEAYTGGLDTPDSRHVLAPFPIWISFLAEVSGIRAVTTAQVVLPVVLIAMTYGIFYLMSLKLFPQNRGQRFLFMIFVELLVLFGDNSFSTVENFMLARTCQGKAVLGSVVIPFLFLLFLLLFKMLQEQEKVPKLFYLLLCAVQVTGCLCSTLGALLVCMAVGIMGLLGALTYRRIRILLPLMLCCVPCVCYAIVYLILE